MGEPNVQSLSGGCISSVQRLSWGDGRSLVRKRYPQAALAQAEAAGLRKAQAQREADGPPVPMVLNLEAGVLEIEDLGQSVARDSAWQRFAEQLARLHQLQGPAFGFTETTFCGATAQPNQWTEDGFVFMAESRLIDLARRCRQAQVIDKSLQSAVESVAQRLPEIVPEQPPVLLHGDLWAGNVHCAADGRLHLIDPACWYGWAECDLALATLFGGFPESFWQAYAQLRSSSGMA